MRRTVFCLALLAAAGPLGAQQPPSTSSAANPALDAIRPLYEEVKDYLLRSAQQMPEDKFDYRPTPEVRSFREILGHVINDQFFFCAAARDVDNPAADSDYEELAKTKAAMIAALKESFAYCDPLYASMSADDLAKPSAAFRGQRNRLHALDYNVTHDFEHYGNLITYFRLNGMVPPSSQTGGAP